MSTIDEVAKWMSFGVVGYSVCKYIFGGLIEACSGANVNKVYERCYSKALDERAKFAKELLSAGKDADDLGNLLDQTLPLPEPPEWD